MLKIKLSGIYLKSTRYESMVTKLKNSLLKKKQKQKQTPITLYVFFTKLERKGTSFR